MAHTLTVDDKATIVEYWRHQPYKKIAEIIAQNNGIKHRREWPTEKAIGKVVKKWKETKSIQDLRNNRISLAGRPTLNTPDFREELEQFLDEQPMSSIRLMEGKFGVSRTVICKAIKDLGLHAYQCRSFQILSDANKERRVEFCNFIQLKGLPYVRKIRFTDECTVHTGNPHLNSRNVRYYAKKIELVPETFYEAAATSQSGFSFSVWAGMQYGKPLAWHIYPRTVRINGDKYRRMLGAHFFNSAGHWSDGDVFQQDGATCHTANATLKYLGPKTIIQPS